MLDVLIVFASEESSPTLFYVMGGIAAAYAVAVAAVGITQPDFPRSQGLARGVFALSALLVFATMASAVLSS